MPDSNRKITTVDRVELLEKSLERERKATMILEEKLNRKNKMRFTDNQKFIDSLAESSSKQVQLQFLVTITQNLFSTKSLDELLFQFSKSMSDLLEKCPVILIQIHPKNENSILRFDGAGTEWESLTWDDSYTDTVIALFNSKESMWHRIDHKKKGNTYSLISVLTNPTLLYLPLKLTSSEQRLMMLDITHYCYNDEFKQTINTAAQQFTLAIKRRATEIELSVNNKVLNDIITQLTSTQQQLIHSEKMACLGQLAAGVAHEINNPIGYVSSNLHVLEDYIKVYNTTIDQLSNNNLKTANISQDFIFVRKDINALLVSCIEGVQRVNDIVGSLKSFSRKEDDDFYSLSVNDVIETSLKIVSNELKYAHEIVKLLDMDIPNINGNHGQLQQVFVNLFVNAAQAMKKGGQLTIKSRYHQDSVEVSVRDTGCGMDESVIQHIFEPFYTTKDVNEGTGLGLSVSYAIVEKHNAVIDVTSEHNEGCTFTLKFPLMHH